MISSAREEISAGERDGPERAEMVACVIYDGFEYLDRNDRMIGRHSTYNVTRSRLTDGAM